MNLETPTVVYDIGSYALTFNPQDAYQFADSSDRMTRFQNMITELLMSALDNHNIEYKFYIELSEPTDVNFLSLGPRLHIHGTIEFKTTDQVYNFLLSSMYQFSRYGNLKMKPITEQEKWELYCKKQQHIINIPPILPLQTRAQALKLKQQKEAQQAVNIMFNIDNLKPSEAIKPKVKKPRIRGSFSP